MNGKGSKRRPGKIPKDCPLWKNHKPAFLKTEEELAQNTGQFVMVDGEFVRGVNRKMDNNLMTSMSFGRHRGQQAEQMAKYAEDGISGPVGYNKAGDLVYEGGYKTQKRLVKYHGQGKLGID